MTALANLARLLDADRLAALAEAVGDVNRSAKAIIRNGSGQILVMKDAGTPWWDFPGGHLSQGESPGDALVREVEEEAGLVIPGAVPLFTEPLKLGDETRPVDFFAVQLEGDEHPVTISEEHEEARWVTADQLRELNLGAFGALLDRLLLDPLRRIEEQQLTAAEQECVSAKISQLIGEGKPQDQAIAIAINTCAPGKSRRSTEADPSDRRPEKISQGMIGYVELSPDVEVCAECGWFANGNACGIVAGFIEESGWCPLWGTRQGVSGMTEGKNRYREALGTLAWANAAAMHVTGQHCEGWADLTEPARLGRWLEGLTRYAEGVALRGDLADVGRWLAAQGFEYGAAVLVQLLEGCCQQCADAGELDSLIACQVERFDPTYEGGIDVWVSPDGSSVWISGGDWFERPAELRDAIAEETGLEVQVEAEAGPPEDTWRMVPLEGGRFTEADDEVDEDDESAEDLEEVAAAAADSEGTEA